MMMRMSWKTLIFASRTSNLRVAPPTTRLELAMMSGKRSTPGRMGLAGVWRAAWEGEALRVGSGQVRSVVIDMGREGEIDLGVGREDEMEEKKEEGFRITGMPGVRSGMRRMMG